MTPDSRERTRENEQTETPPLSLATWLNHDTWTGEQGIQILMGLDPFGTKITKQDLEGRHLYYLESATRLDGRTAFDRNFQHGSAVAEDELARLAIDYEFLKTKWDSGNHPDRNQPRYYIDWAKGKGYSVAHLERYIPPTPNESATDKRSNQDRAALRAEAALKTKGCKRLILENWDKICQQYPAPDGNHVRRWLKNEKICDRLPTLKTIQNHLSQLKADKLIP